MNKRKENTYRYTNKVMIKDILIGLMIVIIISYIFYESIILVLLASPFTKFYLSKRKLTFIKVQKDIVLKQFKDMAESLVFSLNAGYSLDNSIKETLADMNNLHGKESIISKELSYMYSQIRINIPIEEVFCGFASRLDIEDVYMFSSIVNITKIRGGNLIKVIKNASQKISERIKLQQDIDIIISSKVYEQRIMRIIPFLIIIYVKFSNPSFLEVMYTSLIGRVLMSLCLGIYILGYYMGERIIKKIY